MTAFSKKPFTQDGAAICERLEAIYERLGSMLSIQVQAAHSPKVTHLSADDLYAMTRRTK